MITSSDNPKVKYVRRLQSDRRFRMRESAFAIEGTRWLAEITRTRFSPTLVLYTEAWKDSEDHISIVEQLGAASHQVSDQIMAAISDTESPPGILAILPIQPLPLPESPSLLLILDEVRDPGNLGTILRSSAAAGVDGVLLGPGCVDPYNPKVVRGGMGAQLRLPIHQLNWPELKQVVTGLVVWLAAPHGEMAYTDVDWRQACALIVGNEARGAGKQARQLAHGRVSIPIHSATESLNAAIAASVILFEAARQRHP